MADLLTSEQVWQALAPRPAHSLKGSYGRVLAVAGSTRYRGAAALAAEGLLRGGAGLVTLATVEAAAAAVLPRLPEVMVLACRPEEAGGIHAGELTRLRAALTGCSALLMGPGLGNTPSAAALVRGLIPEARCSVVLDADALNVVSEEEALPRPADGALILTPHPGEMARLCHCSVREVEAHREQAVTAYAKAQNCVVVLKGHHTLIADAQGRCVQNPTGNPGLARGGSGDVLAGLITALAAQGIPAFWAAAAGVYLHGAAADACAARLGQYGMLPHDLFVDLGRIFAEHGR